MHDKVRLSADLGSGLSGLVGSEFHRHHRDVGANLVFARDDCDVGNARTPWAYAIRPYGRCGHCAMSIIACIVTTM